MSGVISISSVSSAGLSVTITTPSPWYVNRIIPSKLIRFVCNRLGDPVALRRHDLLQLRHLAKQFHHQSFQSGAWQAGRTGGRWHVTSESYSPEPRQIENSPLPRGFARSPFRWATMPSESRLANVLLLHFGGVDKEGNTVAAGNANRRNGT
jgi:hypothetical protein